MTETLESRVAAELTELYRVRRPELNLSAFMHENARAAIALVVEELRKPTPEMLAAAEATGLRR